MQIILIIKLKGKGMKKLLFIFVVLFITSYANADQRYIWTDENGQTRVSETEPENWGTQNYEETKESKQSEIQRDIKEAQIKAAEERKRSLQSQGNGGKDNATGKITTKRKKG